MLLMKRFAARQISHSYSALLIAGVLLNLCMVPGSLGRITAQSQQELGSFARAGDGAYSHILTTASRAYSEVPASRQKRVRHPALDLTALPPESFQLPSLSLGQRALEDNQRTLHSSFSVRPQGRAPPVLI
jgi:hypothetical protein